MTTKTNPHWAFFPKEVLYDRFVRDNYDSNIFYRCSSYGYIIKYIKKNDNWFVDKYSTPNHLQYAKAYNYNYYNYKILGQNEKYIIIAQSNKSDDGGATDKLKVSYRNTNIIRINKETLIQDAVFFLECSYDQNIIPIINNKDDFLIYYIIDSMQWSIHCYDINNNVDKIILQEKLNTPYTDINTIGITDCVWFNGYLFILDLNNSNFMFNKIKITKDDNYEASIIKQYTFPLDSYFSPSYSNKQCYLGFLHYSLYNIENKYIAVTRHDSENAKKLNSNSDPVKPQYYREDDYFSKQGLHKHVVYKYDKENDTFTLCAKLTQLTTQRILGIVYPTPYHVFFLEDNAVVGYFFNQQDMNFREVFRKDGAYITIGIDEANNFYTFDKDNHCKIYNKAIADIIKADFEKEEYDYNNVDIETYIKIYAKNFLDEYINTTVKIILTGNCKFKDNGLNYYITTTDGITKDVPVLITGVGNVSCEIEEV